MTREWERSWLWKWMAEPSVEKRLVNMILGTGPLDCFVGWQLRTIERHLARHGIDIDTSNGFDWPRWIRTESWVFSRVADVDEWYKTRRWYRG